MNVRRLDSTAPEFEQALRDLVAHSGEPDAAVVERVQAILRDVRQRGDGAVLEYTARFDARQASEVGELEITRARWQQALAGLEPAVRAALETSAARLRRYAEHQKASSWHFNDEAGNRLGQQVTPLDRVGVYVPGGKASYPSSVLMNAIPASVAGVGEIVMTAPAPGGELNPLVLVAAELAGAHRLFAVGGAQAVAALAYGTETIPSVDKIVGPGNAYVATAKRLVFGRVGIDMIAGPSEILVICDGRTDPDWIALDLFSQAEHDEDARAILVSPDADFLDRVKSRMADLIQAQPRAEIIARSLAANGALIRACDLDEAAEIANRLAPEHLELSVEDPESLAGKIRHAGAIFLGRHTPEAFGDYCAGPNHVLPTGGTARFFSPLGVYDFQKRSSIIQASQDGAAELAPVAAALARAEGLHAHAASAECRADNARE